MRARSSAATALLFTLWAASGAAQGPLCGTVAPAVSPARSFIHSLPPARTSLQGEVLVLPVDEVNTFRWDPIDLEGRSITFTPDGAAAYDAVTGPIQYDPDRGSMADFGAGKSLTRDVTALHIPFFGEPLSVIHLSRALGIFLQTPPPIPPYLDELQLIARRQGLIAPALSPIAIAGGPVSVYVKQTTDALTVTWTGGREDKPWDVQALLRQDGTIRFSYRLSRTLEAAGVVLTSGNEPWRNVRTSLGTSIAPSADPLIPNVSANATQGTDLIEFRIDLAAPLALPASSSPLIFQLTDAARPARKIVYTITSDRMDTFRAPGAPTITDPLSAWVEGSTVVISVTRQQVAGWGSSVLVTMSQGTDTHSTSLAVDWNASAAGTLKSRFTAYTSPVRLAGPIVEAFTLGSADADAVWAEVSRDYGLRDTDIDGVAVFENFLTGLGYSGVSAVSSPGNPVVEGIGFPEEETEPGRHPVVIDMNQAGYRWNIDARTSSTILLHEFGHHWLYYLKIRENGEVSSILNPDGGHPAQWVDTRAAFPVYGADDSSVMGGGTFEDQGDGTFLSSPFSSYGYSWLDLYLMCLAAPEEVPSWFYIADSLPPLGNAYFPPHGVRFSGTRHNVTIDQVLSAMGPRSPAFPDTQRKFRMLFVLLADPGREVTARDLELMNDYRRVMELDLAAATGQRASVDTTFPRPQRRRALRR